MSSPDLSQNLIPSSFGQVLSINKNLERSVYYFWSYHEHRQTDRHTDRQTHNLLVDVQMQMYH